MIVIDVFRREDQIIGFTISGHAGRGPRGRDICCAAVSAISQTALLGLMGQMEKQPEYSRKDGWLTVRLPEDLGESDQLRARIILQTMEAGLRSISDEYPRNISIKDGL